MPGFDSRLLRKINDYSAAKERFSSDLLILWLLGRQSNRQELFRLGKNEMRNELRCADLNKSQEIFIFDNFLFKITLLEKYAIAFPQLQRGIQAANWQTFSKTSNAKLVIIRVMLCRHCYDNYAASREVELWKEIYQVCLCRVARKRLAAVFTHQKVTQRYFRMPTSNLFTNCMWVCSLHFPSHLFAQRNRHILPSRGPPKVIECGQPGLPYMFPIIRPPQLQEQQQYK